MFLPPSLLLFHLFVLFKLGTIRLYLFCSFNFVLLQGVEKKSKKNVAIKTFTVKLKEYIKREADLLSLVDHPNIVKFITFEKTKKLGYILVMELCNGCLCEVIYPTGLDYSEFIRLCNGLCNAIQHLWQKDIVHRDIKPENILMVKSSAGQNIYKLGDFGAARILPPDETYKSLYGTYEFLHPDIFAKYHQAGLKEVRRNEHFIATHELWSVGVTLYTAATGQLPFRPEKEREDYQTMFNMITQKQPRHIAAAETKDGQITWSSKLPAHALGISRKRHIETYLAGLLTVCFLCRILWMFYLCYLLCLSQTFDFIFIFYPVKQRKCVVI